MDELESTSTPYWVKEEKKDEPMTQMSPRKSMSAGTNTFLDEIDERFASPRKQWNPKADDENEEVGTWQSDGSSAGEISASPRKKWNLKNWNPKTVRSAPNMQQVVRSPRTINYYSEGFVRPEDSEFNETPSFMYAKSSGEELKISKQPMFLDAEILFPTHPREESKEPNKEVFVLRPEHFTENVNGLFLRDCLDMKAKYKLYNEDESIAKGAFGTIYERVVNGEQLVIKAVYFAQEKLNDWKWHELSQEMKDTLLEIYRAKSPLFLMESMVAEHASRRGYGPKVHAAFTCIHREKGPAGVIVMDRYEGNVRDLLRNPVYHLLPLAQPITRMLEIICELHNDGLYHGDLFARQFLYRWKHPDAGDDEKKEPELEIVLSDFGLTMGMGPNMNNMIRALDLVTFLFGWYHNFKEKKKENRPVSEYYRSGLWQVVTPEVARVCIAHIQNNLRADLADDWFERAIRSRLNYWGKLADPFADTPFGKNFQVNCTIAYGELMKTVTDQFLVFMDRPMLEWLYEHIRGMRVWDPKEITGYIIKERLHSNIIITEGYMNYMRECMEGKREIWYTIFELWVDRMLNILERKIQRDLASY